MPRTKIEQAHLDATKFAVGISDAASAKTGAIITESVARGAYDVVLGADYLELEQYLNQMMKVTAQQIIERQREEGLSEFTLVEGFRGLLTHIFTVGALHERLEPAPERTERGDRKPTLH